MMDWDSAAAGRDNVTCARDLAALLEMLDRGDPRIGAAACENVHARRLRCRSTATACRGLCRAGASYAGKPGDDLPEGRFCHDCGVITTPGGETLVLAVLTDGEGGYEAVSAAGRRLYDELTAG